MLKKSRLYLSAVLAALVMVSMLMTTNVKACEDVPQTLLTLYMNSDLIAIAKYESESKPVKNNEDEYGYTLDSQRKLVLSKVFKGAQDLQSVAIPYSQYVPKPNQNNSESEMEEEDYHDGDYFDVSKMKMGDEYLVFLRQNKETGEYDVTDYMSGIKETRKNLSFYEKNLGELEQIASAKENQYELLTEWIIKSIENEESREDAIADLAESFNGLSYQEEDAQYKGKGPFVVTEDGYGTFTVGVAKHLTPSQKERVSAVLYPMLQEAWFAEKPEYANYNISSILGGINKSRLAMYAYNAMQTVGKNDFERRQAINGFLSDAIGDEAFSNLTYEIQELETKIGEAKNVNTPIGRKQVKDLSLQRDLKIKELDKRFKFLLGRNFAPVENKTA